MHPAIAMVLVWASAITVYFVLPFQLTTRSLSPEGFLVLGLFIFSFCAGAILRAPIEYRGINPKGHAPDFHMADLVFRALALVTIVVFAIDYLNGSFATLGDSYETRNARATAIVTGEASDSTIFFKIGFITYASSFALIAREIIFRDKIGVISLGFFGLFPIVMAALVMGGRGPILLSMVVLAASWSVRVMLRRAKGIRRKPLAARQIFQIGVGAVFALVAMNYFVEVFVARAEGSGGVDQMLGIAAQIWGVDFRGPGSDILIGTLGEGNTYLIFVFIWYLVQGIVMSNSLFTDFDGAPTLGVYGVDIFTAIARRIDPNFVTDRFIVLLDMNIYGFLPAAWGSLFVDFLWFGLIVAFVWGILCGVVYDKTRTSLDHRWLFISPLVSIGIFFSLINTPIGFSNGLVTHFWFALMFLMSKPYQLSRAAVRTRKSRHV